MHARVTVADAAEGVAINAMLQPAQWKSRVTVNAEHASATTVSGGGATMDLPLYEVPQAAQGWRAGAATATWVEVVESGDFCLLDGKWI